MRRQSWALVMASNQNSGKGVLFSAESNGMVQIPDFRWAHHYNISKTLFSGCVHQKCLFTASSLTSQQEQNIFPACLVLCVQCFEGVCFLPRGQFFYCLLADQATDAWPQSITLCLVYRHEAGLQNKQTKKIHEK